MPTKEHSLRIDDVTSIPALVRMAEDMDIGPTVEFLQEHFLNSEEEDKEERRRIARASQEASAMYNPSGLSGGGFEGSELHPSSLPPSSHLRHAEQVAQVDKAWETWRRSQDTDR